MDAGSARVVEEERCDEAGTQPASGQGKPSLNVPHRAIEGIPKGSGLAETSGVNQEHLEEVTV